jgi:hypothetical protein
VKGLASGFEHVATMDLILSMRAANGSAREPRCPDGHEVEQAITRLLGDARADSPSHLYLELLRHGLRSGWDLSGLDLRAITGTVQRMGWQVDAGSGKLLRAAVA